MKNNIVESLFSKNEGYEVAVMCTFGLNLNFFENYLLKLDGLANCDNITIFTDSSTYSEFINDTNTFKPRWINKKYLVSAINTDGIFHPKVYIMASEDKVKIAIGSANLTREGIASNLEIISVFEITEKDKTYSSLLKDCILFFTELATLSKSNVVKSQIQHFIEVTSKLMNIGQSKDIKFIHNLEKTILEQVYGFLDKEKIQDIIVLSPFYDKRLAVISNLRKYYKEANIKIYLQQNKSNFPVKSFGYTSYKVELNMYEYIERYMHGKAIIFRDEEKNYLLTGSPNFTESALLKYSTKGNIESALFGIVDDEVVKQLITPNNKSAKRVISVNDIKSTVEEEELYSRHQNNSIYCLIEAIEKNGIISVQLDDSVDILPTSVLLYSNSYEKEIGFEKEIDLSKHNIKNSKDVYAIQVKGIDSYNNNVTSNVVWLVRLENKNDNSNQKKYRKILHNPQELQKILNELILDGDDEELRRFLLEFDIPLDLVIMSSNFNKFFSRESKGNIVGELQSSSYNILDISDMRLVFNSFLSKLLNKLYLHYNNVQVLKISNFMLIFSTLMSMIDFINSKIYDENHSKTITIEQWGETRDYYNMLLEYIDIVLKLLWEDTKDEISFSSKFDEVISMDNTLDDVVSFRDCILNDYKYMYTNGINTCIRTVNGIRNLQKTIKVKTNVGTIVDPKTSPTNDTYIKEINLIVDRIKKSKL